MAKNGGVFQVPMSQMLQLLTQHRSDRQVKGVLLPSRTLATKGPPLSMVQSSRRQSMSCIYGGSSFSQNASAVERSLESLQAARRSSLRSGNSVPSGASRILSLSGNITGRSARSCRARINRPLHGQHGRIAMTCASSLITL